MAGGHRDHFLRILYQEAVQTVPQRAEYIFLVSDASTVDYGGQVTVDRVKKSELETLKGFQLKFTLGKLLQEAVKKHRPDEVLILELTQYEWTLLWTKVPTVLSAIVFVQPPFIPSRLKRTFKYIKTHLLLSRNSWRTLYFLNGETAAKIMQKKLGGMTRFQALPDPVLPWRSVSAGARKQNSTRKTALYFGAISKRKGFDVLVDAVLRLPGPLLKKLRLVLCGKPEDPVFFQEQLTRLRALETDLELQVEDRFVTDEEIPCFFDDCDWVLMPYTRPEYSSGILGMAAQAEKPVLGPREGLLGELIAQYGLGLRCRMEAEPLQEALQQALDSGLTMDFEKAGCYVAERMPERFGEIILGETERDF